MIPSALVANAVATVARPPVPEGLGTEACTFASRTLDLVRLELDKTIPPRTCWWKRRIHNNSLQGTTARFRTVSNTTAFLDTPLDSPLDTPLDIDANTSLSSTGWWPQTLAIMKVFSNTFTYDYSWEEVSSANWRKYGPWNNKSEHVIAVDTLSQSLDAETGILRTERLITCKQSAPEWIKTILGNHDVSHVYEASYVDPNAKTVTMVSQNLTLSNLVIVQEEVVYQPHGHHQTQFIQCARVTALCGGWQRIKNRIEDTLVSRFKENAVKGREGFERVLEMSRKVFAEERARQQIGQVL
ncbi:putative protein involved in intramitochondrial protein sorting [Drechmeria coniospora]|uniref:PRELI/MSF1 domain-containing protein n=1 Tax=Drechmeria coniospora TaxID=98403 RepID=A0A151GTU3_DRECN|nr:putative protein involved in intramitochondrial protein sorting [Drechmeria coniospora]KYK60517.1 putative protein involved in intramitochondrial protein sorting [Drechmeria coniospora]ODA80672.1 hypothetical protein RJ55_03631 [Drechmeria coniospora]